MLKQQLKPGQPDGRHHAGCFNPLLRGHGGKEEKRELRKQGEVESEGRHEVKGYS